MAAAINPAIMDDVSDFQLPPRKKPKTSDLPLSSAQRASIEGMLHTFKKKGDFDSLRKKAFQQYNESAQRGMFEASLRKFTSDEIDREPVKYLRPDRRLAAPLLEGSAARAEVYEKSQADVEAYIEQYLAKAEQTLREIRRKEIGESAAAEEQARGNKSEEAYAAEVEVRRHERAKKHEEAEKVRLKKEASERKKKELEALKKKQEELMKETTRLQQEAARRLQREEHKKAEKERERERIAKFNEERERQKKEAEEREKALQADREKRLQAERELARKREKERLEQEALNILLSEGRAMSDRARRPGLERSESMEPPPRLRHAAPNSSSSKDEMRARGLMPTSLTLRKGEASSSIPTGPRSDRERVTDDRSRADDDIRRRNSRLRSPSASRRASAVYPSDQRRREDSRDRDYYRESARRDRDRERDSYYRSSDRERERPRGDSRAYESDSRTRRVSEVPRDALPPPPPASKIKEEEGEVIERDTATRVSARPRSRSRDSHRRRDSPPPPPRRSYRERTRSPPRRSSNKPSSSSYTRRDRSRSPAGIDRYVPGGGTSREATRRDRSRDRERYKEERRGASDRYVPGGSARDRSERSRSRVVVKQER